jgi:signal transduction histidine kinase
LFQKFTRLTARPTAGESSTGLGLAIVKRLVEAMHGTIQCSSTLGSGATFALRLPIVRRTPARPENLVANIPVRLENPKNFVQHPGQN